eukprot:9622070-Heterocapsa_arctica.AAC.1
MPMPMGSSSITRSAAGMTRRRAMARPSSSLSPCCSSRFSSGCRVRPLTQTRALRPAYVLCAAMTTT